MRKLILIELFCSIGTLSTACAAAPAIILDAQKLEFVGFYGQTMRSCLRNLYGEME